MELLYKIIGCIILLITAFFGILLIMIAIGNMLAEIF